MKKSNFVRYHVVMAKNIGTAEEPHWVRKHARGIVRDIADKLGAIFRQNPGLTSCTKLLSEYYEPICY